MRVVYKYKVAVFPLTLTLDKNYKVVLSGVQNGEYFIWIEHDLVSKDCVTKSFSIYPTGNDPIPNICKHESSFQDGSFVWHVYSKGVV